MRKALIGLMFGSIFVGNVEAATWYGFLEARSNNTVFFFDLESVSKQPGSVKIWVKAINSENSPDADGSHAEATQSIYSCKTRTVQTLIAVLYDKDRNHMRTNSNPGKPIAVVPDSVAETILKTVCASDFPNTKSFKYVRVGSNDVYAAAKRLLDIHNDPAPQ